jgi:sialic acid synthase SpsE
VGKISRHADRNHIIFAAELIKLRRKMAAMAVKNQKTIFSSRTTRSKRNKDVFKLTKAYFVSSLSIRTNFNLTIAWELYIFIPALYIDLSFEDNAWRKHLASRINTFD